LADFDAELEQFAVDSGCAPERPVASKGLSALLALAITMVAGFTSTMVFKACGQIR